MSGFNPKIARREGLSKDDAKYLRNVLEDAIEASMIANNERVEFLIAKLKRLEK